MVLYLVLHCSNVPTTRKRHSITETPPVQEALDRLRSRGVEVNLPDLVVRGADMRLRELEEVARSKHEQAALRERFLERSSSAEGIDVEALIDVHEHGWRRD